MDDKIKCLYYIKDSRTDEVIYIGQTKDFKERKHGHFTLKRNPIDKYMYEEGRKNFSMEIFTYIDCTNMTDDEILNKEDELILYYDTINNGFNKYRSGAISNDMREYKKNYMREYHKDKEYQKEYHSEYMKKYYQEHKEYNKNYYQEHKDKIIEKNKSFQQTEKRKEYIKNYQQTEKYKEYQRQYRLKKKQEKTALSEG